MDSGKTENSKSGFTFNDKAKQLSIVFLVYIYCSKTNNN